MWTLGYNDNGGEFSFSEPFNGGRKLRPLVPRPLPSLRVNGTNFCAQYYHLAASYLNLNEQSKKDLNDSSSSSSPAVVVSSSRWNPTAEQLRILEELYRRGTRTPSADQIQHITAQLRRYGKIEGKNVFYWFQNHKARERQKRRRQTAADQTNHSETEKGYEIQQTKTNCCWPPPSNNCTTTLSQEREERRRRECVERDGELVINPRRKTLHHLNGVVESYREKSSGRGGGGCETTTLQLFPLRSTKLCKTENDSEREGRQEDQLGIMSDSDNMTVVKTSPLSPTTTFQFFEFLPLKN